MPSNHLILCLPLLLPPSIFPSIRVFSNESVLPIRWLKYWSFSFSISHSNEYSGLISFRIDWFDLLTVQGTPKSLLQHHSSKLLILWRSSFFVVQLSYTYVTTGKTIALTRWTFVGKVMYLLFNILSRFGDSDGKASAYNAGDPGSIPGLGRSPGEGNGNPLQCSCLENLKDGGARWVAIYGVVQSQTWLKRLSSSSGSTSIHDYWKTVALTRRTFVGKATPLLSNMLSRFVIASLPRSKRLLI